MGQTFPVGILLLEETEVPEENHEPSESHKLPVQLVLITTEVVSSNPRRGEEYLIQHYVITFVSDLRQVSGFLRFAPPIKLTSI
jgi:hypothetical protein